MNSFDLMHALGGASEEFVEEALSEPLNNKEQPVTGIELSGGSGESERAPHRLLLTVLSAAACLTIAAGLGAAIWRLNRPGITTEISVTASQTEQTDPGTNGNPSAVTDLTETQTTATASGTQQTETAVSAQTAAAVTEPGSRTSPHTTAVTTAHTTETVSQDTRAVTSKSDNTPETVTTTVQHIQQADPDAVIAELRTGMEPFCEWDRELAGHSVICPVDYQAYGVAFLCRDSDLSALKTRSIGSYPVNWAEGGAWAEYGGNGYGFGNIPGWTEHNALVQTVSAFAECYGDFAPLGGILRSDNAGFGEQYEFELADDYSDCALPGWTVCMAAVNDALLVSDNGGMYHDYSALIRAISADPDLILLGIVRGRERGLGFFSEFLGSFTLLIDRAQFPALQNASAAETAYGTVRASAAKNLAQLTLSQEASELLYSKIGQADASQTREVLREFCAELESLPGVRMARPDIAFYI